MTHFKAKLTTNHDCMTWHGAWGVGRGAWGVGRGVSIYSICVDNANLDWNLVAGQGLTDLRLVPLPIQIQSRLAPKWI